MVELECWMCEHFTEDPCGNFGTCDEAEDVLRQDGIASDNQRRMIVKVSQFSAACKKHFEITDRARRDLEIWQAEIASYPERQMPRL